MKTFLTLGILQFLVVLYLVIYQDFLKPVTDYQISDPMRSSAVMEADRDKESWRPILGAFSALVAALSAAQLNKELKYA